MQSGARRSHRREHRGREAVARTNLDRPQVHPRRAASRFGLATAVARPWRRRHAHWISDLSRGRTRTRREDRGVWNQYALSFYRLHPECFWCGFVGTLPFDSTGSAATSSGLPPDQNFSTQFMFRPTSSVEHFFSYSFSKKHYFFVLTSCIICNQLSS